MSIADWYFGSNEERIHWGHIGLSAFVGCSFLTVADLCLSEELAITTRIADVLGAKIAPVFDTTQTELIAFLILFALGLGLCYVFKPRTRPQAFVHGSSVIGVLVGMNIGVSAASAEPMIVDGAVTFSTTKPREFGPLGIGTLLTGKLKAEAQEIVVNAPQTIICGPSQQIGQTVYCPADGRTLGVDGQIWIMQ